MRRTRTCVRRRAWGTLSGSRKTLGHVLVLASLWLGVIRFLRAKRRRPVCRHLPVLWRREALRRTDAVVVTHRAAIGLPVCLRSRARSKLVSCRRPSGVSADAPPRSSRLGPASLCSRSFRSSSCRLGKTARRRRSAAESASYLPVRVRHAHAMRRIVRPRRMPCYHRAVVAIAATKPSAISMESKV